VKSSIKLSIFHHLRQDTSVTWATSNKRENAVKGYIGRMIDWLSLYRVPDPTHR